jgi:cytochrome c biogenesis protein CcdA
MEIPEARTWVIFYLLSFVVLLVSLFLTTQESGQLWISLMLIIVVVGINFATLFSELKKQKEKKQLMKRLSGTESLAPSTDTSGRRW